MTKKQMQARIAELELMVQTLTTAINSMHIYYVGPTQPIVNPLPIHPVPMPYIGDYQFPFPYSPVTTTIGGEGLTGGLCDQSSTAMGRGSLGGIRAYNQER
jgi:hypothetical protein